MAQSEHDMDTQKFAFLATDPAILQLYQVRVKRKHPANYEKVFRPFYFKYPLDIGYGKAGYPEIDKVGYPEVGYFLKLFYNREQNNLN